MNIKTAVVLVGVGLLLGGRPVVAHGEKLFSGSHQGQQRNVHSLRPRTLSDEIERLT